MVAAVGPLPKRGHPAKLGDERHERLGQEAANAAARDLGLQFRLLVIASRD
jgi:hypothetical protein